ncbi:MAG: glutamine--fructose-6-phosphate transaminase (isomerizing) [Nitrospira sp.]|nr:glutamine--fructose-6-phosphate transaminase (isomerizing) [Nitrospira sp.]MDE0404665.1 glutamine--fructose-6-phosphate transaminase (isomerizing) [Nitrospira sp.]MDE0486942.1 glutamine--fructose-6-phosphate transaminase (isomerizing) [Nitrospira sp.]
MCGIIGYIGDDNAAGVLMQGLRRLEYRGYDSAGIAVLQHGRIEIRRSVGKLAHLEDALKEEHLFGTIGIGHTRWATHGKPSEQNAHPHRSGNLVIVHNGIIENYLAHKRRLETTGYRFESETDTEVIAHLLAFHMEKEHSLEQAFRATVRELHGSYAIAGMCVSEPETLVVTKSGCPLVLGHSDKAALLASDVTPLLAHTRNVTYLEDGDVGTLTPLGMTVTGAAGRPVQRHEVRIDWNAEAAEKGGYPHFMLKEIHEQPQTILDTLRGRYSYDSGEADLPDLAITPEQLRDARSIWIVACGTSWHAGLVGKYLLEELVHKPVQVDIGSEFRYRNPMVQEGDVFIAVSQSGETADTLAAAREARRLGAHVLSIVNVVGSTLARESDGVIYTRCGPEISVASTKAFTGQLLALYLLALHVGRVRQVLGVEDGQWWLDQFMALPGHVEGVIRREAEFAAMAERFHRKNNFLYLGRGINYPIALEGALKLKEISYIHAEGYAAGEMKHGPIALIDEDVPVVVLAPRDRLYDKTMSNLMEVKARSAPVIAFVSEGEEELEALADCVFRIPNTHALLSPVAFTAALQLLAYHIATRRNVDVDRPRNLAKSVTVE